VTLTGGNDATTLMASNNFGEAIRISPIRWVDNLITAPNYLLT